MFSDRKMGLTNSILKKLWIVLFMIQGSFGFAQQPELKFTTLNALDNITNIKATSIIQDSTGYLWIGTEEGLLRFNGQSVYTYQYDENNKHSILSNNVDRLFLDNKNNLWICTKDGLCMFNPEYDNFTTIISEPDTKGFDGHYITAFGLDHEGQIYLANEKSIFKFEQSQNLFIKVTELKQGSINAFVFDHQNNIWIASSPYAGLYFYNQANHQLSFTANTPGPKQAISASPVSDLALVNDKLWITTYGAGIDTYSLKDKTFKHYLSPNYFENYATSVFIDRKNMVWICTLGALKLFDQKTDNFFNYYYDEKNPNSLGKNLWRFYEDKQGNYWTVHSVGGLKLVRNKNAFKHFTTSKEVEAFWTLTEKNITSISSDSKGNLWAGNYNNGIDVFNWQEHQVERYFHKDKDLKSLGNGTIFSIFRDSKNQMWVGSNMGGLQKFNPKTKDFESYLNKPGDTLSIANNDVRSISEDSNGDLWLAVQPKGVDRFDVKRKTFQHFNAKNNHLGNDYTFQVLNDSKGNLWVATVWGLSFLKKGDLIFKNFITQKGDSTSINDNDIHSVYEDGQQNIWISTAKGLNKFNPESQTFTRYSVGLRNKKVVSIISDQKNNLWVGTPAGISKFDTRTNQFTNFDQRDGLLSREFTFRTCNKNDKNELFFGGNEGIDFFNPDSLNIFSKPPPLVLTDFRLNNKVIQVKTDSTIVTRHINYTRKIKLDHKSNSFTIFFQGIDLTNAYKISYTYKLEGFDKDWIFSRTQRNANYANLNPGSYTFMVKARYGNGNWSEKATSVEIIISPVWWKSLWFTILVVLIIVAAPFGFVYWRVRRMRLRQEQLEMLVAERTNEIVSKNELLKSQALTLAKRNEQLKDLNSTKDKLFSIISHDLRSPFNAILGFQDLLLNNYHEISEADRIDMIRQTHSTTNHLYYLVENLLNWARIQTSTIRYIPSSFNLKELIVEKIELYNSIAETKGITFTNEVPDDIIVFADVNLLNTTLRNLINNAIKFTPTGGSITINARKKGRSIKVSVSDSGIGMTREQIDAMFDLEKTITKDGTNGEKGSGLGLVLCKEFVEKNKGTISVISEPGKGSTFSFTVPISPTT